MKLIFPGVIALLLFCGFARAQESSKYVSPTFQDILSRVTKRDKTSGAILTVKPKSDSASPGVLLRLSLEPGRISDETVIMLKYNNKVNDGIYEKYRLRTDDAMREEMKLQALYLQNLADAAKKREEQFAKEIELKTTGTLHYGMTTTEVITIKGEPLSLERVPTQRVKLIRVPGTNTYKTYGSFFQMTYPNMSLIFMDGHLHSLADIPHTGITDITLNMETKDRTLTPEKFKELLRTAVPMAPSEYSQPYKTYEYWCKGSFLTADDTYTFFLGVDGLNKLTTQNGSEMYFKFTEK